MKYLVVDDDAIQQTLISNYAQDTPGLTEVGTCSSAMEATEVLNHQ